MNAASIIRKYYKYLTSVQYLLWDARDSRIKSSAKFCRCAEEGANKTQIVYSCNLNFHTVVPYLELLIRNGLAERVEGEIPRYRTTRKGAKALRHFQEIEKLMPEMEVQESMA